MATARVAVSVQSYSGLPEAGLNLGETAADASNGNRFDNVGLDCILVARNSGASTRTVQFSYLRRGQTVSQSTVSILAGDTHVFGPFPAEFLDHDSSDAAPGNVYVTASHAEVLLSVVKLPRSA